MIRNTLFPISSMSEVHRERDKRRAQKLASVDDRSCEEDFFVPRITFKFSFHGVNITGMQFPVLVSFAGTVHKAQGQRLKKEAVHLRSPSFSPFQLNVALSAVRISSNLLLLYKHGDIPRMGSTVYVMLVPVGNPVPKNAVDLV